MPSPIRFFERVDSRGGTSFPPSLVQKWRCTGTNDASFVRGLAQAGTAPIVAVDEGILYRQDVKVDSAGHKLWDITVPYGPRNMSLASARISFDTTGGTIHITNSKATVAKYPNDARDFKGLIGVKDAKTVEGCDVVIPAGKLTVKFHHPIGVITMPQIDYLMEITGTVNSVPFLGRAAGEVLFLGSKGDEGTDIETDVSYDFAISKNLQDAVIAGISGVNKEGWDAYWVDHAPAVDGGKPVRQARSIYIERVYDRIDLATALGFGG